MTKWNTNLEILTALQQEIIRLGIQDNPSRTVYQRMYDRNIAPNPNSVITRTGMKWTEIIALLNMKYDSKAGMASGGRKGGKTKNKNAGRKGYSKLSDEEFMNLITNEFNQNHFHSLEEYDTKHKKGTPSLATIMLRLKTYKSNEVEKEISNHLGWKLLKEKDL